jgi:thymidylate synthase (FAD)
MNVKLINITPNAEEHIVEVARVSSSRKDKKSNYEGLIRYLIEHKHWSPFEHAYATFEIETSKAIGIQLIRHRSFTFQEFCVSGDTLVKLWYPDSKKSKQVKISQLYERYKSSYWSRGRVPMAKVYDEESGNFVSAEIKEVFKTGVKPVVKVTLDSNNKHIVATKDHKLMTKGGFKTIDELSVGDFVAINGELSYRNKDWLEQSKAESLSRGGVQYIADKANVSYHTIRKWLSHYGLSYTKQEVAMYSTIWNKGLAKELQPRYGKNLSFETREKIRFSSRKGPDSNLYSNADVSWRKSVANWGVKQKNAVAQRDGISVSDLHLYEVDHILPVYSHPELAFDINNLQLLTKEEHKAKSMTESFESKYVPKFVPIKSIEPAGEEMTYDLEVMHSSHNYVANGIVTHNSQRYQDVNKLGDMFESVEMRRQAEDNRQSSTEVIDLDVKVEGGFMSIDDMVQQHLTNAERLYNLLLSEGVARETARMVLPLCTKTKIHMTGNVRSWIHFIQLRADEHAQKEIRSIAEAIRFELSIALPTVFNSL